MRLINLSLMEDLQSQRIDPPLEEEQPIEPPKFDRLLQTLEDAVQQCLKLDPSGESRSVVIAVTTSQGKEFEVIADSTDDQRFKGWTIWSKIYVEAEVTKVTAPVHAPGKP